ncbi:MAG: GNAT family N-acetyltransferase [Candidatus Thiodiazotropha sp.]
MAWCAYVAAQEGDRGIALARYIRLDGEDGVAEFALTVVDAFQGQGVGNELLKRLIETARDNRIAILRGYILPSNRPMLNLCEKRGAVVRREDSSSLVAEILLT